MSKRTPFINFAEVKQNISMEQILEAFEILDQFERSDYTLSGACPLPTHPEPPAALRQGHERNREQFKVDTRRNVFYCHSADHKEGGDQIEFIRLMVQGDHRHVRQWLLRHFREQLDLDKPDTATGKAAPGSQVSATQAHPDAKRTEHFAQSETPLKKVEPLGFRLKLSPCGYLRDERGIDQATADHFGVGMCSKGQFAGRCVFPIFRCPRQSPEENPVSYVGRATDDSTKPRWKQIKDFPMRQFLYGINECVPYAHDSRQPVFVVEGAIDVLRCYQAGLAACSSIGAYLSDAQADMLLATGLDICLMFDGDSGGQTAMNEATALLARRGWVRLRILRLPDGSDPADHQPDALRQIVDDQLA